MVTQQQATKNRRALAGGRGFVQGRLEGRHFLRRSRIPSLNPSMNPAAIAQAGAKMKSRSGEQTMVSAVRLSMPRALPMQAKRNRKTQARTSKM